MIQWTRMIARQPPSHLPRSIVANTFAHLIGCIMTKRKICVRDCPWGQLSERAFSVARNPYFRGFADHGHSRRLNQTNPRITTNRDRSAPLDEIQPVRSDGGASTAASGISTREKVRRSRRTKPNPRAERTHCECRTSRDQTSCVNHYQAPQCGFGLASSWKSNQAADARGWMRKNAD